MAYYSQKRSHSMITRSREPIYLSPAAKRPRTDSIDTTGNPSRPSCIESLPTEILQLIFFASLNGNFLRAAPRIAAKLSGSRSIHRTAFFVAFYHPHLVELRDAFKFSYLLPDVEKPIPSWELRSMQKIVLDSRWCTFKWFKGLASELLDHAYHLYRSVYATEVPPDSLDRLDQLQRNREDIMALCDRASGGNDAIGQYIELVIDPFNLSINVWPEEEEDEHAHEDEDDMCEKARRWHLQLRGVGSIPLRPELLRTSYDEDDHFRLLVNEIVWEIPRLRRLSANKSDIWEYLEASMLDAISKGQVDLLQELLEINYFFWPEDAPFKLSPRLFVAAARSDDMQALCLLFQVDPTSLPRSEKTLQFAALDLQDHSNTMKECRSHMRWQRRDHIACGGVYSEEELRRAMQLVCYEEYMEDLDDAIAHYIRTGCLMRKANPLSPDFFLRTKTMPVQEIYKSKLFGYKNDGWLADEPGHTCNFSESVATDDSDVDDGASWNESDFDYWPDAGGLDTLDDEDTFTEDERPIPRRLPSGLDWTSILSKRGDDWLVQVERKEDYHYMMP